MNPKRAMNVLSDMRARRKYHSEADIKKALKLGEEALERLENCRVGDPADVELPLPSETS